MLASLAILLGIMEAVRNRLQDTNHVPELTVSKFHRVLAVVLIQRTKNVAKYSGL